LAFSVETTSVENLRWLLNTLLHAEHNPSIRTVDNLFNWIRSLPCDKLTITLCINTNSCWSKVHMAYGLDVVNLALNSVSVETRSPNEAAQPL
jgi:hypothetical protein